MSPVQARIEVRELTPIEMVDAVADYFDSLGSEVVRGAADAEPETFACAVEYWKACETVAAELRLAIGKYEDVIRAHLNSDCAGH